MTEGGPSAPSSEDPLLGKVLSERYRILSKLGEGGMGVVYLAEHVVIEKRVALKVLFPDLTRRTDLVRRFIQEAKSASRIGHENVIDITDFGQSAEGYVFIAMEYLSGQDMGQVLKATGVMPWARAQPLLVQIVKALRAAHEKAIVHRDMKPENIFVLPRDDGRELVKVLDFGIAKVMGGMDEDAPRLTRTGMIFGTPEYMSPEQAQGAQIDHRVDIYAVGCIMYQMLTGQVPFRAESFMGILSKHMVEPPVPPRVLNPAVDPQIEAVILRAMQKDPARRYQSMRDFLEALRPLGPASSVDTSGAFSAVTGQPVHGGTSPSQVFPFATHEVETTAKIPLARPNPEVRRSQTAVFAREDPAAPRPKRTDRAMALAVGAGAAVLVAVLVLLFRGKSPAPDPTAPPVDPARVTEPARAGTTGPAPGTGAPAGAALVGEATAGGTMPPGSAAPAGGPGGPAAGPAGVATPPPGGGPAGGAAPAGQAGPAGKADKKNGGKRRSSREAVDALFTGDPAATPRDKREGKRTPEELKNPFAAPGSSP